MSMLNQRATVRFRDGHRQVTVVVCDEGEEPAAAVQSAYDDGEFTVDELFWSLSEQAVVEVCEGAEVDSYTFATFRNGAVLGDLVDAGTVVSVVFEDVAPAGTS